MSMMLIFPLFTVSGLLLITCVRILMMMYNYREVQALLRLREVMWSSVHFFVTHHNSYVVEPEFIKEFRTRLLSVLGYVLKNCDG